MVAITGAELSGIWLVVAIVIVILIVWKLGKLIFKLIFGLISNIIMGFITLLAVNYFFGLSIPYSLPVIVSTVFFGLGGIGTIIILRLFGIAV